MRRPTKREIEDAFAEALQTRRQISIEVVGRRTGRTIRLPVWFVSKDGALWLLPVHGARTQWYRNLLRNPAIAVAAGKERRDLQARALRHKADVSKVIRWFGRKYTPDLVERLYPGPLDVAIKVKLAARRLAAGKPQTPARGRSLGRG